MKSCEECGGSFEANARRKNQARFCSPRCRMASWGKKHPRVTVCPHCGKSLLPEPRP